MDRRDFARSQGYVSFVSFFVLLSKGDPVWYNVTNRRSRQKKRWEDNIKEGTGMVFAKPTKATGTGQGGIGWLRSNLW